jgi:NitT/TauT family transport system substrate-binding protein
MAVTNEEGGAMNRVMRLSLVCALLATIVFRTDAHAQSRDKVTFVLDWVVFGRHAPYFAALEKGFFTANGIDATVQRGYGSATSIKRLGAGQADFVFADFGGLVLARANEGLKAKMVAMGYGKNGHAVFFLESSGIKTPKDLVGKRIAGAPGATVTALFPGFLRANGVDPGAVRVINVDAQALNPMVLSRQADGMLEFNFNQVALEKQGAKDGLKPNHFMYADYNFGFYANGVIARDETLEKSPDLVARFVDAIIKGYRFTFDNPAEACTLLRKQHTDIDQDVCLGEVALVKGLVLTPEAQERGIGFMSRERVQKTVDVLREFQGFKGEAKAEDLYSTRFLPRR